MTKFAFSQWVLALSSTVVIAGCASLPGTAVPMTSASVPADAVWQAAQAPDGQIRVAYYDAKRHLYVLDPAQGTTARPFHAADSGRASSGLDLAWQSGEFFVAFRDKEPQRDLFVGPVERPQALRGIGADSVPLARARLFSSPAAGLSALWYGEKHIDKQQYHVYYRDLGRDGTPRGDAVQLFQGIYPVGVVTPSGRFTAVTWYQDNQTHVITARTRDPVTGQFGPERRVAEVAPLTPVFEAVNSGERILVFWHAQYGQNKDQFRFEGALSDDGVNWQRFHLSGLDGMDIESADFASDGQGNIAVVVAAIPYNEYISRTGKMRVYVLTSHDGGVTWSVPRELRQDPLQKDKVYSHARAPKAIFLAPGKLLVAWQDWRSLRSAIHMSYSEDAGKTWAFDDIRLTDDPRAQEGFAASARALFPYQNGVRVVYEKFEDDARLEKRIQLRTVDLVDLRRKASQSKGPDTPDRSRLEQRVMDYWRALQSRDHEKTYAMLDPYFRAKVRFDIYKENLGKIEYRDPELKVQEFYGPLALAVTKMTLEVKPFTVNRKTFKLDPVEKDIPTRWIWIDGDWYMEYRSDAHQVDYTPF